MAEEKKTSYIDENMGISLESNDVHKASANPSVTYEPTEGSIVTDSENRAFTITCATNHNEIKILESDWDEICRKVKAMRFKKNIDWASLLWGVTIPFIIDFFVKTRNEETINYFPLTLCFLLIIITTSKMFRIVLHVGSLLFKSIYSKVTAFAKIDKSRIEEYFSENESDDNRVHHQDLLNALDRISKYKKVEAKKSNGDVTNH